MRQTWKGQVSDRATGKHVARFILVALYTGSRAGAICAAGFERVIGRSYIDLDAGIFYRARLGARKTNKRQPPVHLPSRLLAHIRRWRRLGISTSAVVEWNGKPIQRINKAFRSARKLQTPNRHRLRHRNPARTSHAPEPPCMRSMCSNSIGRLDRGERG